LLALAAGTIVNAPLGKIYLMTADHCFTDKSEVSDFEFWMLLFNYYTQCGNDTSPPVTEILQVRASEILYPLAVSGVRKSIECLSSRRVD